MKPMRISRTVVLAALLLPACKDTSAPNGTPASTTGRRLIAGETVACALTSAGAVFCWGGSSNYWEYGASPTTIGGDGFPTAAVVPTLASLAQGVGTHFCGLASGGNAICWARNDAGQLGSGVVDSATTPGKPAVTVVGGLHWKDISVSRLTTCALSEAGAGYCWGLNQRGEVGSSSIPLATRVSTPSPVEGGFTFKTIAAGWLHSCGITTAGALYCWGGNQSGQLGIGTVDTLSYRSPMLVGGGLTFAQISLGSRYSCALTTDGTAYCWGENATGQIGDNSKTVRAVPTPVTGGLKFAQIMAGSGFSAGAAAIPPTNLQGGVGHTCALTTDGKAYCWGWNGDGEIGDGTTVDKLIPTAVSGGLKLSTIAVGGAYSCGMEANNVWCWGSNANGQIGNQVKGSLLPPSALTPQPVSSPFKAP